MKPVVSSLVALAIAIAPLSVMAKPAHQGKTSHAKVSRSTSGGSASAGKHKAEKGHKAEKVVEKADKCDKAEKSAVRLVKASKKDGALVKNVAHHAHNADVSGSGHSEPKVEKGVLVAASMRTPLAHGKAQAQAKAPAKGREEMPKLPSPNAGKPSKGGAEKGARKPAGKKIDSDDGSGEPTRDEDNAELVARIRGRRTASSSPEDKDSGEETRPSGSSGAREKQDTSEKAEKAGKAAKNASHTTKPPCTKDPVEVVRGPEIERFELTTCDGKIAPLAVEHLSILIRPGGAPRPTAPLAELAKKPGSELAKGIRRVDPRLIERIQAVVDHFSKSGTPAKLSVISGYRPASVGSMHSSGRAIDFRIEGVKNEDVVLFCKTLPDTGCGFYPNSSFVHVDVRDPGAGHVSWIDASGPGETPRYVPVWPPPAADRHLHRASATQRSLEELAEEGEKLLRARRPLERDFVSEPVDDHPAEAEK